MPERWPYCRPRIVAILFMHFTSQAIVLHRTIPARKMFQHSQIACPFDYFWLNFVAERGFRRAEAAKVAVLMVPLAILISLRTIAKIVSMVFWFDDLRIH
ncbi:hypothetical protein A3722_07755 [Sulfitobacter sp. HI0027]|nr:hypothetical protein A3722_07755 [Sulfitobacter sp. HI0027]